MSAMMIQTWALFVDAYRELNSKRLFWITMTLSALVVAVFGMFGINERGLTFLWWEFPLPLFNSTMFPPSLFYRFAFATIGVPIWLTWIATALALISTASIIPDFVASGSIELTLSKPIGRLRLFMTKFLTGLLFVGLQVAVFTLACFLVIGIRGGEWEWRMWLAVPIVLLFFSYLFSVCTLAGLLTRSTIAALLTTLLCWVLCFALNVTDSVFVQQLASSRLTVEDTQKLVTRREEQTRKTIKDATEKGIELVKPREGEDQLEAVNPVLKMSRTQLAEAKESLATWEKWTKIGFAVKTCFPKTSETIGLLNRRLVSVDELVKLGLMEPDAAGTEPADEEPQAEPRRRRRGPGDPRMAKIVENEMRSRSMTWIIGTSIVFEAAVLGLACLIFVKRDF